MASTRADGDSFAFTTGGHGTRPTYLLTPLTEEEKTGVILYRLLRDDVADAREQRHAHSPKQVSVTTTDISDAVTGQDAPTEGHSQDATPEAAHTVHDWTGWCAMRVARIYGETFSTTSHLITYTLREAGVDPDGIEIGAGETRWLPEAAGVRLAVAFTTAKPLRRPDKIRHVADAVKRMSLGECYYWNSKLQSPSSPSAATALRELLTGHIS